MNQTPRNLDAECCLHLALNGTKLIEASAGTGKTYTMANLYLRHVLAGYKPQEILVVTFTNAATEELRGRIRKRLYDSLMILQTEQATDDAFLQLLLEQWQGFDAAQQQKQTRQLQMALRTMDEAAIYTIHGFCQRALGDHALYTGQFYEATLLLDDNELWEQALKDWWRRQSYLLGKSDLQIFNVCLGSFGAFSASQRVLRSNQTIRLLPEVTDNLVSLLSQWQALECQFKGLSQNWFSQRAELLHTLQTTKVLSRSKTLPYAEANIPVLFEQLDDYFASEKILPQFEPLKYLSKQGLHDNSKPSLRGTDDSLQHDFFVSVGGFLDALKNYQVKFRCRAQFEAHEYAVDRLFETKQKTSLRSYDDQLNYLLSALNSADGDQLAQTLRQRYPNAMIDEFQDTDATQYDIFKQLYFDRNDTSLTMIGDPKQAIYSFRGGDIFTYMNARRQPCVEVYSLQTNWRSEAKLVAAVNHVFSHRDAAFIYADSIEFNAVEAAVKDQHSTLFIDGQPQKAMTIWEIPPNEKNKPDSKTNVYSKINLAIAAEISHLIKPTSLNGAILNERAVRSDDIAILVRTSYEGNDLREVLSEHGIKAITIGRDTVYDSDEAKGLFTLLQAVVQHTNRRLLRCALASDLLSYRYEQIERISNTEIEWQTWLETFAKLNQLWRQKGFIIMFQYLLQALNIGDILSNNPLAERRLTNLLQLSELIQQHSRKSPGLDSMMAWFKAQVDTVSNEETELRLESDEPLVKIVTIHKSKGLEYPIVFVPYLWTGKPRNLSGEIPLQFHDADNCVTVDFGSAQFEQHGYIAEKERLAEDIRLGYVALTRARSKVYVVWGKVDERSRKSSSAKTALGYLLHPKQAAGDLLKQLPNAFDLQDNISPALQALCDSSHDSIELLALPPALDVLNPRLDDSEEPTLSVDVFTASIDVPWRINSFTALTRQIHQVAHGGSTAKHDDAIFDFPAGSNVGLLIHSMLEHFDFQGDITAQCERLSTTLMPRFNLEQSLWQQPLIHWFEAFLRTPLLQSTLSLSALPNGRRLNELAFDFAIDRVDIARLNETVTRIFPMQHEAIASPNLRGLITGIIDLVFEFDGKFYLADYKTNFLGTDIENYATDKLQQAMFDRRYELQSLIYSIALHRYLKQRLSNYDYEQHFGGSYYLFLRGMRPQLGADYGVYFHRPEHHDLLALDRVFSDTTDAEQA